MNVTITPTRLRGTLTVPPSKSQAHRLLIAAALADGDSQLTNVAMSQDIAATIGALRSLGAVFSEAGTRIHGIRRDTWQGALPHLDCGESRFHAAFSDPHCAGCGRRRCLYWPGPTDAAAAGADFELFLPKGKHIRCRTGVLTGARGD